MPVVSPIQPGDRLSHYSGAYENMPYNTWFLYSSAVHMGEDYMSLAVRRRYDDEIEVAGSFDGDSSIFLVVDGYIEDDNYVVSNVFTEYTEDVTDYEVPLSDLANAWGGGGYHIVDDLLPHVGLWFEL